MWLSIIMMCAFISHSLSFNPTALQSKLSSEATISADASSAPRWSEFQAPRPGAVVNVATEKDVEVTVQYCIQNDVPFLAQNGGNGWATTFTLDNGIIINLGRLNKVAFNSAKTQATLQGGALVSDVISAAAATSALVPTGICNCVGALGVILGGGLGNLMGLYGLGVENLQALKVVTPEGKAITVTAKENSDLWWAMRGAGPNFGIVTSAVMNSYPVSGDSLQAWLGPLIFTPDKLELIIQAIDDLSFQPEMALSMTWVTPGGIPTIIVSVFYYGTAEAGKAAFASIYAVGPIADRTAVTPYTSWNNAAEAACVKGGRRPNFGVGLARMDPDTWRAVFNKYTEFVKLPGAGNTTVLLNAYPTTKKGSALDCDSSYPFRNTIKFFAGVSMRYTDSNFDSTAVKFGSQVRDIWRKTDGLAQPSTYINNAFGDESLSTVYGDSLKRLKSIKAKVDPQRRFNQ